MDEFHLDMSVRFSPDETSLNELSKTIDSFDKLNVFGGDSEKFEKLKANINDFATRQESLLQAQKMLNQYRDVKGVGKDYNDDVTLELITYMKQLIGSNETLGNKFKDATDIKLPTSEFDNTVSKFSGFLKTKFIGAMSDIATRLLEGFANLIKGAWEELGVMVQSSLLTNANTRENAFSYGFSPAESYAFDKAKSILDIQSEEDLMYMNDFQKDKFREIMSKYADKYNKLYDSGFFEKYLEFQIEMEEFKLDMQIEIIEFFMQNKDTIKQFMEISMKAMEFIVEALGWLMGHFSSEDATSDRTRSANINEIINGYTNTNNSTTIKQTFNNNGTFNGTTDSQKNAYLDMLNAQMVEAKRGLGGLI